MGELKLFIDNTRLDNRQRAINLHNNIVTTANLAAEYFVDFCEKLKQMRDENLFVELGYESFEQYTESALNIKQRQAYTYISTLEKLGPEYLEQNANLGISKLSLIASASAEEREQLTDKVDIETASVAELERALKEIENMKQQLTFLQEENEELKNMNNDENERDDNIIDESEIEKRIEQAKQAALSELQADYNKLQTEKAEIERKVAEAEKEKEQAEKKAETLEQELELEKQQVKVDVETQAKIERLEKQLKVSADPIMTKFKFMLGSLQDEFNQLIGYINVCEEEDKQDKMRSAANKIIQAMLGKLDANLTVNSN